MNDREFLEALHTQLSNHLVMPEASKGQSEEPVVKAVLSAMAPKAQFEPGKSRFKVQHAPGQVHLEWVSDKALSVAAGGLTFSSPPQWSAFLTTEGEITVDIDALGSGTLWMSA